MENFEINFKQIDQIEKITLEEKNFRIKNLNLFKTAGFPSKKFEDWKFTDFRKIVDNNFVKLDTKKVTSDFKKTALLKNFDHNYIILVNGSLHSNNFDHEDKSMIKINSYDNNVNYELSENPLICLNHALAENGFSLEVLENYKFNKTLVIYNFFTKDVKDKILNNKNKIKVKKNSELHIIEYTVNESNYKFINNVYEDLVLEQNSKLKNLYIQSKGSEGFFHKYSKSKLSENSDYVNLIFSSGLRFNKLDIECDLIGKNCSCNILSALFLSKNEHQEIKTRINHLVPDCKSYQRVKQVLDSESKGIFQGKVYVKDVAQKTNAYQLSKALLLHDDAEFNSKPELEIYADDVNCSHGSTSGSIDEDSLHYLMTRGLNRKESINLLIKGFLNDVVEFIKNPKIKEFVANKLEDQVNGHK